MPLVVVYQPLQFQNGAQPFGGPGLVAKVRVMSFSSQWSPVGFPTQKNLRKHRVSPQSWFMHRRQSKNPSNTTPQHIWFSLIFRWNTAKNPYLPFCGWFIFHIPTFPNFTTLHSFAVYPTFQKSIKITQFSPKSFQHCMGQLGEFCEHGLLPVLQVPPQFSFNFLCIFGVSFDLRFWLDVLWESWDLLGNLARCGNMWGKFWDFKMHRAFFVSFLFHLQ